MRVTIDIADGVITTRAYAPDGALAYEERHPAESRPGRSDTYYHWNARFRLPGADWALLFSFSSSEPPTAPP